jgi:formiminoglutamase
MRFFEPAPRALFFKSPRPNDTRIGELVSHVSEAKAVTAKNSKILLGYPDDEGIRVNFGRLGAKAAPDAIRASLYKLTPGLKKFPKVYDIGNLRIEESIAERHQRAKNTIAELMRQKNQVLSFGGGHDYAYPDVLGFLEANKGKKPLVLNFDAHLDVRTDQNGINSGSAFFRLFRDFGHFELVEIGIQSFCNSAFHMDFAKKNKIKTIAFEEAHGNLKKLFKTLSAKKRPLYLSVDLDAFSTAYAQGVSAGYPVGLDANEFYLALPILLSRMEVCGAGFYEVSPPLDPDGQTAKLAAILARQIICHDT